VKEKEVQSASIVDLPNEILEKIFDQSSIKSIENLKTVCQRLYIFFHQYFGIELNTIALFSFEESKNDSSKLNSAFLYYRPFHTAYQLKKMFSIFLNSQHLEEEVKLAKIKKFKFEPDSIPFCFQQAMLARHPVEKDTLFQKGVYLLEQNQDDYPIAKDFLAICLHHDLGVDQNEKQAEILENEVSSHLLTHFHRPWFPWSFQLLIEPIFIKWSKGGNSLFLLQIQRMRDFLDHTFLNPGQHRRSYACVDFVKNWLKSDSTLESISSFLESHRQELSKKFKLCKLYLSLLAELGVFEAPWPSMRTKMDYSTKKGKAIQPILKWLTSEEFKEELHEFFEIRNGLTFSTAKVSLRYIDVLSFLFENLEELNPFKENLVVDLLNLFNDQKEDDQDYTLLKKFKIAELFQVFQYQNWEDHFIKDSLQNWLSSEKTQFLIQEKMLDGSFFQREGLNCHHVAMYFINKNRELAEKELENVFKFSDFDMDDFDRIQLAQYLNQLGKLSIFHLESIKEDLKNEYLNDEYIHYDDMQCDQEFSRLKCCFRIGCYSLIQEEIKNILNRNLENLTPQEARRQWQLASLCADSGDRKFRIMIHQKWINLKKIRSIFKKLQIWDFSFPKRFEIYISNDPLINSDMGIIYFNCL